MTTYSKIGIIGGAGIIDLDGLMIRDEVQVQTPFGAPSGPYLQGDLLGMQVVLLNRVASKHYPILSHEMNDRANIFGMKQLGVNWLISLSAVRSMREEIRPGDMVIVDQFVDHTHGRVSTFFGDGIGAHLGFSDPVDPTLADLLEVAANKVAERQDFTVHRGGTNMVINGPQLSTRAESKIYRSWGVSVIGMDNMPEAKLAREAELSYANLAQCTGYDAWYEGDAAAEDIVSKNEERGREIIRGLGEVIPQEYTPNAVNALPSEIKEGLNQRMPGWSS